jgi:hypothetical protein
MKRGRSFRRVLARMRVDRTRARRFKGKARLR